jgi:lysozyme
VNWKELFYYYQLDSVITFVYCKATEGNDHIDSQWENNRKTLLELGKANGAYHFLTNQSDPESQAKHFLTYWKKENNDLPPVLDVEVEFPNDKALISSMKSWLSVVEKQTGMRPVIYTSLHFYETKFQHEFKSFNFWIASYSRRPPCLDDPRILHWQYSEKGVLPGIRENVDFSVSKISFL